MHPLNNKYFGSSTGDIACKFNDGNSVVSGYIVKQLSLNKYIVAANANVSTIATLSSNAAALALSNVALNVGEMTINVYPVVGGVTSNVAQHVAALTMNNVKTVEGKFYHWNISNTAVPTDTNGVDGFAIVSVI